MEMILTNIVALVNDVLWNKYLVLLFLLLGSGVFFTIRTNFVQVRKFSEGMRLVFGNISLKGKEAGKDGMSSFQALATAIAAQVGTGNIAGCASALVAGGPGAVFWMWISALLGMGTKFAEVTLAVHFRERNAKGDFVGGPMYYIKNGLGSKWMWLAYLYAFFGVCAVFGTGNATQVNTITAAINTALLNYGLLTPAGTSTCNLIIGIIICIVVALILIGGIKRIGRVTERLVPIMAILYIALGIGLIVMNISHVPAVFASIFQGAFNPTAVTGGIVGSFFVSMQKGVSRGIFSNEAGLGTGSIAHACADTNDPAKQGMFGIFEVFMDTIVICTMTALVILLSGVEVPYGQAAGAELTISGFTAVYGNWVSIFTAVAMCCFAFSTILGWGLYGARCAEFLLGSKILLPFNIAYALVAIVGATVDLGLIWGISDTFNGFMTVPNLIAVFLLTPVVLKLIKSHFEQENT